MRIEAEVLLAAQRRVRLAKDIAEARARLCRLAARYPLQDRRVLAASRALDRLIAEAHRREMCL